MSTTISSLDDLPLRLESLCRTRLSERPIGVCLQELEALGDALRQLAVEVDQLYGDVCALAKEQRDEDPAKTKHGLTNARGGEVPVELRMPGWMLANGPD